MTSKEQERKALEKIRKIVAELGEDSYLAAAFEGCFEDAERNIDEDAAYSMKARLESAEKEYDSCVKTLKEVREIIDRKNEEIELMKKAHEEEGRVLTERIGELNAYVADLRKERYEAEQKATEARKDVTIACGKDEKTKPFARLQYFNVDGFRFINIVEPSGWTNSYKLDEITKLEIE